VQVNRPGLNVRTHSGYLETKEEATPAKKPGPLVSALVSPFRHNDLNIEATAVPYENAKHLQAIAVGLHLRTEEIAFHQQPDGIWAADGDIAAILTKADGTTAGQAGLAFHARVKQAEYDRLKREGMDFNLQLPNPHPGFFDLRVAVSDTATGKIGTTSEIVEIGQSGNGYPSLTGILLRSGPKPAALAWLSDDAKTAPRPRTYRGGDSVTYSLQILNPKAPTQRLETSARILRNGALFRTLTPERLETSPLRVGGTIEINDDFPPGVYAIEIGATARGMAAQTQRAGFQVVK
jgi:hypothetical protein